MKNVIFLICLLSGSSSLCQSFPEGIKYQAIVRDAQQNILSEKLIGLRFSILDEPPPNGTKLYVEEHQIQTSELGIVSLVIGEGNSMSGIFSDIPWQNGQYWLEVQLDIDNSGQFKSIGTHKIQSVPYAFHAQTVGDKKDADADPTNEIQQISKTGNLVQLSSNGGSFEDAVDDMDPDSTNEIQDISASKNGSELKLSISGGQGTTFNLSDEDADPTNEIQRISKNGNIVQLSGEGGSFVDAVDDMDPDSTNEIQSLSIEGNTITLSKEGGSITMPVGSILQDNDTDTKVQVEGNPDEDIIRIDLDGIESITLSRNPQNLTLVGFPNNEENIFIGNGAGEMTTTGKENVFIGMRAGQMNTTGNNNTSLGTSAGLKNSVGIRNTFIGNGAGSNTKSDGNTMIGFSAGVNNKEGKMNTFVGYASGIYNTTGDLNTFIGANAGQDNTLGSDNTFLGVNAGKKNTSGGGNTFVGNEAGYFHSSGRHNTFLGSSSGRNKTEGSFNTFVGSNAGQDNENGTQNTFIGSLAGGANNSSHNTFVGDYAGRNNINGMENVFIGSNSGLNATGSGNVFVGASAGSEETENDKLYISNNDSPIPLIWGDFVTNRLGINRKATTNTLEVEGTASKSSAGDWLANSDARLKKNIKPMDSFKVLEQILQLNGITYEWNDYQTGQLRPDGTQIGFTAQNIRQTFPDLVTEDNKGFLQTAYGTYDPLFVEAFRALDHRIKKLEIENQILKEQIQTLEQIQSELEEIKSVLHEK